jgi:prepilin-type N-terminal cleavage/methylation domain-containing protein
MSPSHTTGARTRARDRGFTLVELLIVIAILGVLASVTVFAVRGITDQGKVSACGQEVKTLESAQENHMAKNGSYALEADLVTAGFLRSQSRLYDVTLATNDYTLTPVDAQCGGTAAAPTTVAPTIVAPTTGTVPGSSIQWKLWGANTSAPIVGVVAWQSNSSVMPAFDTMAATMAAPTTFRLAMIDSTYFVSNDSAALNAIGAAVAHLVVFDPATPGPGVQTWQTYWQVNFAFTTSVTGSTTLQLAMSSLVPPQYRIGGS